MALKFSIRSLPRLLVPEKTEVHKARVIKSPSSYCALSEDSSCALDDLQCMAYISLLQHQHVLEQCAKRELESLQRHGRSSKTCWTGTIKFRPYEAMILEVFALAVRVPMVQRSPRIDPFRNLGDPRQLLVSQHFTTSHFPYEHRHASDHASQSTCTNIKITKSHQINTRNHVQPRNQHPSNVSSSVQPIFTRSKLGPT